MGLLDDLVAKDVRGLKSLQVSGQTRLDGGTDIISPLRLDSLPVELPLVWQEILLPSSRPSGSGNIGVSFRDIPQGFRLLQVDWEAQATDGGVGYIWFRINGITGNGAYIFTRASFADTAVTIIDGSNIFTNAAAFGFSVAPGNAAAFGMGRILIPNYANSSARNHGYYAHGSWWSDSTVGNYGSYHWGGALGTTAPITQLDIGSSSATAMNGGFFRLTLIP